VRTNKATEWVAANNTTGGTNAAPAAKATAPAGARSTAWATLPVTDIEVATISHVQKNRAAPRRSRMSAIRTSAPPGLLVILDAPDGLAGMSVAGLCSALK
jgi:hypothetical protein